MICVHDFPSGEILAKVGVMKFGPNCMTIEDFEQKIGLLLAFISHAETTHLSLTFWFWLNGI